MSEQVSKVVSPINITREFDLSFRLLVPLASLPFLSSLEFSFLSPPLLLFILVFLFHLSCWLPFRLDEFTESTYTIWVILEKVVACLVAGWLIVKFLILFVPLSTNFVLTEPKIPSTCGPGLNLGLKFGRGALGIFSYRSPN